MQKKNAFLSVLMKRLAKTSRPRAVHPPIPACFGAPRLRQFVSARKTCRKRTDRRLWEWQRSQPLFALLAKVVIGFALFVELSAQAGVREVGPIGLTVGNLNRELAFYTNTLPFELISVSEMHGQEANALLGLKRGKLRIAELKLGEERIQLTEHLVNKGKPIPEDSRSDDHWFQHIAIVVRDMDAAYAQLRAHGVKHVSTGPQTLPDWNKNAGGIKAFYFCDPENHVLEIIYFPPGKGNPKWQQSTDKLFLGIDHTAIVVSDTEKSLRFYRDALGLQVAGESENYGVEQEHLNQVFGARLHITGLRAESGPGVEFLEYITPPGGRDLPPDASSNDLVFWNTRLVVDDLPDLKKKLTASGTIFVSKPGSRHSQIVRDPDGHAVELDEAGESSSTPHPAH